MASKADNRVNAQIYEQACEWLLEFRSGQPDAGTRGAFDRWIRRSPEHVAAYLEAAAIWDEAPSLDAQHRWSPSALVADATKDPENVIALTRAESPEAAGAHNKTRGGSHAGTVAIAASILIALAGVVLFHGLSRDTTYSTGIGEQRSIVLDDGSTVELNSRSELRIAYSDRTRTAELVKGQALFNVTRDTVRPFIVASGAARIHVLGTQFDVYRRPTGTTVTVLEGRVAIDGVPAEEGSSSVPGESLLLSAGEQVLVTAQEVRKSPHPDVAAAAAWTERQLVFNSASLAEVAEEFNRYNERQLVVVNPALYDFHVSGVFSSSDPASLIRFLSERPGVRVIVGADEIRVEKNSADGYPDQGGTAL